MTDHEGPVGPKGDTGETGAQGVPGPPGPTTEMEKIPAGYQHVASFIGKHPRLRSVSMTTLIVWIVILVGGGITIAVLHISDRNSTNKVASVASNVEREGQITARNHNAEACTLRVLINGLKSRAVKASKDMATSEAARDRAKASLDQYAFLLAGQITQPSNLNCGRLLRELAAPPTGHR